MLVCVKKHNTEITRVMCDNRHIILSTVSAKGNYKTFFYKLRFTGSKVVMYKCIFYLEPQKNLNTKYV